MKKITIKVLIFITLIALTLTAKAQKDYVITIKGDSVPCKITWPMFGGAKYKSVAMSQPEWVEPDEIKEYYVAQGKKLYRAVFINNRKRPDYLPVFENGKISLYQEVTTTAGGMMMGVGMAAGAVTSGMMVTQTFITWYVGKNSDHVVELKNHSFLMDERKDNFAEMLQDNKSVYDQYLAGEKSGLVNIRNLVHLYNTGKPFELFPRDYMITNNKDTIFCEIELNTHFTNSRYRLNKKARFVNIDTSVTEYFVGDYDLTIMKKSIPNEKTGSYVRLLTKGRINLYEQRPTGSHETATPRLYASKGNAPLVLINAVGTAKVNADETNDEQKTFVDLFADNLPLQKEIQAAIKHDYSIDAISDYVNRYNLALVSIKK